MHTANKYEALNEAEVLEENIEDVLEGTSSIAKDLSAEEVPDLNIAMWNIRSMNKKKKQKDVLNFIREENINVCGIIETHIKPVVLSKVANFAFGGWEWVSNSSLSIAGCRILIG
ncbi:RNA-directed DNA polymerase, eukaryota, Reverse transcriptase zinc-binding domain protein [Artemisia annua]|uniref:RNA-directed DNA polymerase, eukaryota, Reverse transcriptase zinc-binding domain protein n=1 Tax=Artemisia annua TaxID=35608 RepID=A0A2U1KU42_ARTAN|nr:RNA-directed DNA polymerase, eukaryota, Reverse transcriptase zinc-binding domain protein [Artemisia annua]